MKKLVFVFITCLGISHIYSQGLICDGINIGIVDTTNFDYVELYPDIDTNTVNPYSNVLKYWWDVYLDGVTYSGPGDTMSFDNNNSEIIYSCLYVQGFDTLTKETWMCYICDSIYSNEKNWGFDPVHIDSIDEINNITINGNYYDLLGRQYRDFNSIPIGSMYIRDRKVYFKNTINEN
jgi:hypothetical protein